MSREYHNARQSVIFWIHWKCNFQMADQVWSAVTFHSSLSFAPKIHLGHFFLYTVAKGRFSFFILVAIVPRLSHCNHLVKPQNSPWFRSLRISCHSISFSSSSYWQLPLSVHRTNFPLPIKLFLTMTYLSLCPYTLIYLCPWASHSHLYHPLEIWRKPSFYLTPIYCPLISLMPGTLSQTLVWSYHSHSLKLNPSPKDFFSEFNLYNYCSTPNKTKPKYYLYVCKHVCNIFRCHCPFLTLPLAFLFQIPLSIFRLGTFQVGHHYCNCTHPWYPQLEAQLLITFIHLFTLMSLCSP